MWRRRILQLAVIIILYVILQDGKILRYDKREDEAFKALYEADKKRPTKRRYTLTDIENMDW